MHGPLYFKLFSVQNSLEIEGLRIEKRGYILTFYKIWKVVTTHPTANFVGSVCVKLKLTIFSLFNPSTVWPVFSLSLKTVYLFITRLVYIIFMSYMMIYLLNFFNYIFYFMVIIRYNSMRVGRFVHFNGTQVPKCVYVFKLN